MIPAAVSLDAAAAPWWRRRRGEPASPSRRRPAVPVASGEPGRPVDTAPRTRPAAATRARRAVRRGRHAWPRPPGGLGSSSGRFAGFDGLRALAALGVLVTHVGLQVGFVARDSPGHYLARLDVGVAMFFVLSGFLLYRPFVARRMDGRPRPAPATTCATGSCASTPAYWLALTVLAVVLDVRDRDEIQSLWRLRRRTTACCRATRRTPRSAACSRPGR